MNYYEIENKLRDCTVNLMLTYSHALHFSLQKKKKRHSTVNPISLKQSQDLLQSVLQLGASLLFVDELFFQVFGQLNVFAFFDLVVIGRVFDFRSELIQSRVESGFLALKLFQLRYQQLAFLRGVGNTKYESELGFM